MATWTSQSRNFPTRLTITRLYMDLVVVNRVLELLSAIADARVLLLIDAVPSQAAIALISDRLPVAHTPTLAAIA